MPERVKDAAYWSKAQETNNKRLRTAFAKGQAAARECQYRENNPYKDKRTASGGVTWSRAYRRQWFEGFDSVKPMEGLPLDTLPKDTTALIVRPEVVSGAVEPDGEALMRAAMKRLMDELPASFLVDFGLTLVSDLHLLVKAGVSLDVVTDVMNLCRYHAMREGRAGR